APSVLSFLAAASSAHGYGDLLDLLSFPTRRSSDLGAGLQHVEDPEPDRLLDLRVALDLDVGVVPERVQELALGLEQAVPAGEPRSEEHTSELQSRENLVCRLLLEKKKQEQARAAPG